MRHREPCVRSFQLILSIFLFLCFLASGRFAITPFRFLLFSFLVLKMEDYFIEEIDAITLFFNIAVIVIAIVVMVVMALLLLLLLLQLLLSDESRQVLQASLLFMG